jgi:hypothetical protein
MHNSFNMVMANVDLFKPDVDTVTVDEQALIPGVALPL